LPVTGDLFLIVVSVVLGLIFGSFGTVAAYRIPRRENIVTGRSMCPHCGRMIRAYENVPLFSYLLLRGRCAGCKERISARYPITEATTGVLFGLAAAKFGPSVATVVYSAFFWVLVVLTVIDLEHKLLPTRVVYPALAAGWVGLIIDALVHSRTERLLPALVGSLIFGVVLFIIAFISPGGMGGGDVRLAYVLGTFLGYLGGAGLTLAGMFLSFFLGGLVGIGLLLAGQSRKAQIPFGPYLALGTVVAIFLGEGLLDLYLSNF
jgi:leader peptidase (prepilin peptidase)/N-methyltransferase